MTNEIITTTINKLNITSLAGVEMNLRDSFVKFNIYEGIFENYKLGSIVIKDTADLINRFPILGGEEIEIYFTTENDVANQKAKIQIFKVYNIAADSNVQSQEDHKKLLTLYFCSPEMITDLKTSICRRFNTDAETIFEYIIKEVFRTDKDFYLENVETTFDFISNFWTVSQVIKYLENNAIGTFNDYIFYENIYGFNFKSLSQLLSDDFYHEVNFNDNVEMIYDYKAIKSKMMKKQFNDIESLKFGAYGNTFFKVDSNYYGFDKYQYDFHTVTQYNTSLGQQVQHREELLNNNDIHLTYDDGDHEAKRSLILKSLSKYHQILKMNGDSTKTIGQLLKFNIEARIREEIEPNEFLSGKWFITNINHEILHDGTYTQIIKAVKNAFFHFEDFENTEGRRNL